MNMISLQERLCDAHRYNLIFLYKLSYFLA